MSMNESPGDVVTPLAALEDLFHDLRQRGIRHCHWKSNSHLAAAVHGETDLDLLVDREQVDAFQRTLSDHDFKAMVAAPGKDYPGVENYLGFDESSGRLIHLHVHYLLVLGQQHVKDHRIPIEEEMLDSTRDIAGVLVPSAAMELIVLAMRAVLKYRTRDAAKDVLGIRTSGIPRSILAEAEWLFADTSMDEIADTLADLPACVPSGTVTDIIDVLVSPGRHGSRLLLLKGRLRRELRPLRRVARPRATARYFAALWRKRIRSIGIGRRRRMTPESGGITVAFIGSDGAGKTTVVSDLERWLSWRLDVSSLYMGTSQPTAGGILLKRAVKLSRSASRYLERNAERSVALSSATLKTSQFLLALRRVEEARRRHRTYVRAHRRAARGAIVLFDRYPLPSVPIHDRPMDGPRLDVEIPPPRSRLFDRLSERERQIYRRILPPDHVVALQVSADISLRRKPDHDPSGIEAKTRAIRQSRGSGNAFIDIDADQPLELVVAEIRKRIWGFL